MLETESQVIWVTGASSGIGGALAVELAREGHRVIISGRSREKLEKFAADHEGELIPLACDVSDDTAMQNLFGQAGITRLDTIVLCAGVCEYIDLPDMDLPAIRRVFDTNFFGIANACAAALPLLKQARRDNPARRPYIVGVSSMSCYKGFPRAEAYGSSKAAMSYFLESLRSDLQQDVDVSIVYPGFVATPMTAQNDFPMPTMVTVEYAARYIRRRMQSRPFRIVFPRRLHWILKLAGLSQHFWFKVLAPKMSRVSKES